MKIRASFIGVDRHRDPEIRDLTGARRDATALWALFEDTLPELESHLLVDDEASVARVSRALDESLGAASAEDIVILSFSGHGTHDHRLVLHDTSVDSLDATTIAMGDLARRFRETNAKIVVCILDCCFSGGAPARVLESSPIPRDGVPNPLAQLGGKGRILIAASGVDEEALELADSRHGILTKALIDALEGSDDVVRLPSVLDVVMERVRAEAARVGHVQTPVFFGTVEGGLTLPALRRGARFRDAFPDLTGIVVEPDVLDLQRAGLPQPIVEQWSLRFSEGLNGLQLSAVNEFRILDGDSLLVVAPTSAGKTFIGEMAAARAMTAGQKAVFLFPYKALVNEKYEQFRALYGDGAGLRVIRCSGDYTDEAREFTHGKFDLALFTYEMFLNISVGTPSTLNQLGLVVVDEAQFLTDPNRGIAVELLLTHLLSGRARGVIPQIIALSAVIGDINNLNDWIGCAALVANDRPVPLIEGVLDRTGTFEYVDASGNERVEHLLPPESVQVRRNKPSAQDMIVPLVRTLVSRGEKVIVFRNRRGPAAGCAAYLARDLSLSPADEATELLPRHDMSSSSHRLRECLSGGTAFHSSNLSREEKVVVENVFRDPNSPVRVLAATTTVAAGINTPASTVVLAEREFLGEDGRPFTVAEYKNMAGRAGRLGYESEGKAIILADHAYERSQLFQHYVKGKLEPMSSSFDLADLDTWIVRLLAQVRQIAREDVLSLLANTYGGYLEARRHPGWEHATGDRLEELMDHMIQLELVEEEQGRVQLTLLGRACGRSALTLSSALRLVDLLKSYRPEDLSPERLMAIVQALPESDAAYTPMMRRGQRESTHRARVADRYGHQTLQVLQRFAGEHSVYWARCKRAAILWDWINGVPLDEIEQVYTANPYQGAVGYGDVRRFADLTRFHLRSASEIASLVFPSIDLAETMEPLLKRLEVGLPEDGLGIVELPLTLGRGEYLAFLAAGIRTPEDVFARPGTELSEIVGSVRAAQLERLRGKKAA